MTLAYFLLSCFQGIRECFIPFSPRKSIAWLSTILLMIVRNAFQNKPIRMVHYKPILGTGNPRKHTEVFLRIKTWFRNAKKCFIWCLGILGSIWYHPNTVDCKSRCYHVRNLIYSKPTMSTIQPMLWIHVRVLSTNGHMHKIGSTCELQCSGRLRTKTGHPVKSRGDHYGHACIYRTIESQALKSNRNPV